MLIELAGEDTRRSHRNSHEPTHGVDLSGGIARSVQQAIALDIESNQRLIEVFGNGGTATAAQRLYTNERLSAERKNTEESTPYRKNALQHEV